MLEELTRLHSQGHLDEAESGYRELLAAEPDNVDVLHLLGLLRRQRQDLLEARQLLDKARRLAPERGDVALELAGLYFLEQDLIGARVLIEETLKHNPNQTGAHTLLGRIALIQEDLPKAETLFRTALRTNENDAYAIAGLGRLLLDRGEAERSLAYLSRAVELVPKDANIVYALARALVLNGNRAFGEQAARNALALQPELHAARHLLGQLMLDERNFDEALATFAVLSEAPGFKATALFGLADVARQQLRLDRAVELYREGLALEPDHVRAVQLLGSCLIGAGRSAEALALYQDFLARNPHVVAIEAAQADLLAQAGNDAGALAIWQQLAQRRPNDPIPLARLAVLHERGGDFAGADALAARVASALPDDVDLVLLRSRSAQREGRDADSLALLESLRSLPLSPFGVMQAAHQYGVLADRSNAAQSAVPAWLESQASLPVAVHEQPSLGAELDAALAVPAAPASARAPIFLLGLPGSMVERIAALLHQQPGLQLLRDRAFAPTRNDAFSQPDFAAWATGVDADAAQTVRQQWEAEVRRIGADPEAPLVDWLVRWDARLLPLLRQAFPGATLIVVERDPRDLLLNWLAFGWMAGFPLHEPAAAARWLKAAQAHLARCDAVNGLKTLRVDADAVLLDPIGQGQSLAAAVGLDALLPGEPQRGLGGLVIGLPAGRWEAYAEVLGAAFAEL